jgi:hypothetical protein
MRTAIGKDNNKSDQFVGCVVFQLVIGIALIFGGVEINPRPKIEEKIVTLIGQAKTQ